MTNNDPANNDNLRFLAPPKVCAPADEDRPSARAWMDTSIDSATPSIARVYDAVLGGKDNFAVDREVAQRFLDIPGMHEMPWDNRHWLQRLTHWLVAHAGIGQIIDIGSGLPTTSSIHTFATEAADDVRVVYVDNDPIVLAHGQALLAVEASTTVVTADARDPDALFAHPDLRALIDLDAPYAVLLASVLHHLPDGEDQRVAAAVRAHLRPGCYLAIANFCDPGDGRARAIETALADGGLGSGWARPYPQHRMYFGDLDLISPGLGPVNEWKPRLRERRVESSVHHLYIGALGYRP